MNYIKEKEVSENTFDFIIAETKRQRDSKALTLESKINLKIRQYEINKDKLPSAIYLGKKEFVAYPKFFVYTKINGDTFTFNTYISREESKISFYKDEV